MPVLLADGGIWPFVIFAIIAMLLGGGKKKTGRTMAPPTDGEAGGGLMSELNKALEELKRAEREAVRTSEEPAGERALPAPPPPVPRTSVRMQGGVPRDMKGGELVKRRVFLPKPKPARPRGRFERAAQQDADQAFEDPTVISLEQRDYDDEAEKVVKAREAFAARRAARREESVEGLSAEQQARRADRAPAAANGGIAEHAAWHARRDAVTVAPVPPPAASRLSRFGGGRRRDAIVLTEILGRPVGER